jgi:hypothetical protein
MRHELITLAIVVVGIFICVKGVMRKFSSKKNVEKRGASDS